MIDPKLNKEAAITYAELKIQIKDLEDKLKALQPDVLSYIQQTAGSAPALLEGIGTFTWYPKKTYKFTAEYDRLAKLLEERKKEELATGTYLSVSEIPVLVFKALKE